MAGWLAGWLKDVRMALKLACCTRRAVKAGKLPGWASLCGSSTILVDGAFEAGLELMLSPLLVDLLLGTTECLQISACYQPRCLAFPAL
jgi:hypothetical protein